MRAAMAEVACAVCGMAFEEEGALEMGASFVERGGRRFWFCGPPCEKEFLAEPARFGA